MSDSMIMPRVKVECEMLHPILVVPDVHAAVIFYTERLGFWLAFEEGDPPGFAGVNLGRVQVFFERGEPCPASCGVYFVVNNVEELYRFHESTGARVLDPLASRSYHLRDYTVADANGYRLTFGQRLGKSFSVNEG
jgi:catechol 2,3-dioxygenase-like lactoylglutathione lyase family enzyme